MSTETSTPDVTADARADAATPPEPTGTADEFPFESSEFGVGGFLPHLGPIDTLDQPSPIDQGGETR